MSDFSNSNPVARLILEFSKLPGIGEKTAMRLAYHVLKTGDGEVKALSDALLVAKNKVRLCDECFTFTEVENCATCASAQRDDQIVCVVEKPSDVLAVENSHRFNGKYHVLHGVLSPLDGVGPEQLKIRELIARLDKGVITEVMLALNPSVEGEATVVYISKLVRPLGVKVTKIAHGIPMGGVLEYLDRQTIGRAIDNRVISQER